ncbi:Lrp/AsnC family transcriptional regulator [Streptomyces sp. NPDC059070]|uniref:Lrp/AsnC family transcriptional regulator n=1 Tax=Streptomyces sp. NPDC059070 TaxID=3346713 RepID=UPI0036A6324C
MGTNAVVEVLDSQDQRLIAALQCDGRIGAERAGEVLGIGARTVQRRWRALLADGAVRVVALPAVPETLGALLLRIKVLRGRLDTIAAALAAREDVPFIDVSASGDEIAAVARTAPGSRDPLLFRQLPATQAVTSVTASTVLHAFRLAHEWRHDVLTPAERAALTRPFAPAAASGAPRDALDHAVLAELAADARVPAAMVAARLGQPESTVRRRLARLGEEGLLLTQVAVDARRLGLAIDANVLLQLPPDRLDAAGRALAAHPAVHGAFATTGEFNLHAAVWVRDLAALYRFVSDDLSGLGVSRMDTVIVGQAVKRPGSPTAIG